MGFNDRRLTGRDVLAKTFHAKTKRGYDPVEVDAYLELVAAQIDVLHGDIGRATQSAQETAAPVAAPAPAVVSPELEAELEQLRQHNAQLSSEHAQLSADLAQEQAQIEALRAENQQLRVQLTAIAPPPPSMDPDPAPAGPAPAVAGFAESESHDRAGEESYELVLRMAHRTAEDTIAQAHARADEIVAEAEFNAAQIGKESDRKAFEAANRVQTEIASLNAELDNQRGQLTELHNRTHAKREELRGLAHSILQLAEYDQPVLEGAEVVDLRQGEAVGQEVQP